MNPNQYYPAFGMNNPYQQHSPYGQMASSQMQQQGQNILPRQTVIQVDGKASVDAIRMAPNSSVLLMDRTAPVVWLCTSDGLGQVTSVPYDIAKHQDAPPVDVNGIEQRVAAIEAIIEDMKGGIYGKSNARTNKPRQNARDAGERPADKEDV